jgi:hypothetical protein
MTFAHNLLTPAGLTMQLRRRALVAAQVVAPQLASTVAALQRTRLTERRFVSEPGMSPGEQAPATPRMEGSWRLVPRIDRIGGPPVVSRLAGGLVRTLVRAETPFMGLRADMNVPLALRSSPEQARRERADGGLPARLASEQPLVQRLHRERARGSRSTRPFGVFGAGRAPSEQALHGAGIVRQPTLVVRGRASAAAPSAYVARTSQPGAGDSHITGGRRTFAPDLATLVRPQPLNQRLRIGTVGSSSSALAAARIAGWSDRIHHAPAFSAARVQRAPLHLNDDGRAVAAPFHLQAGVAAGVPQEWSRMTSGTPPLVAPQGRAARGAQGMRPPVGQAMAGATTYARERPLVQRLITSMTPAQLISSGTTMAAAWGQSNKSSDLSLVQAGASARSVRRTSDDRGSTLPERRSSVVERRQLGRMSGSLDFRLPSRAPLASDLARAHSSTLLRRWFDRRPAGAHELARPGRGAAAERDDAPRPTPALGRAQRQAAPSTPFQAERQAAPSAGFAERTQRPPAFELAETHARAASFAQTFVRPFPLRLPSGGDDTRRGFQAGSRPSAAQDQPSRARPLVGGRIQRFEANASPSATGFQLPRTRHLAGVRLQRSSTTAQHFLVSLQLSGGTRQRTGGDLRGSTARPGDLIERFVQRRMPAAQARLEHRREIREGGALWAPRYTSVDSDFRVPLRVRSGQASRSPSTSLRTGFADHFEYLTDTLARAGVERHVAGRAPRDRGAAGSQLPMLQRWASMLERRLGRTARSAQVLQTKAGVSAHPEDAPVAPLVVAQRTPADSADRSQGPDAAPASGPATSAGQSVVQPLALLQPAGRGAAIQRDADAAASRQPGARLQRQYSEDSSDAGADMQNQESDIERLARQVYARLRQRLLVEAERLGR